MTHPNCNGSCCNQWARFRVRLAFATRSPETPGVTDITIPKQQLEELLAKYGCVAEEGVRHFIVQARGLGLGGEA